MEAVITMPVPDEASYFLAWRKSTRSIANGDCAEVASSSDGVAIRDTKDRSKLALRYPANSWRMFVSDVRSGTFDAIR